MSERYVVKRLDEIAGYADPSKAQWFPIRADFGIAAFGVNAWRSGEAGQELIGEHDELGDDSTGHEELYVVLSGRAGFTVDGVQVEAPAGTLVFVRDPATKRAAVAAEDATTVLVVGARSGEAFTPSGWEASAEALRYWTTKEYGKAIELLATRHEEQPENATVVYNLACAESLDGRVGDALAHLERAIELRPSFREAAQTDTDFDAIRADPRFPAAAG
ncbi:MAG: TPR end-of-group domain-containing protein [Gaiellaceae bacterium]